LTIFYCWQSVAAGFLFFPLLAGAIVNNQ